jgi:uncharacterized membrane protein (DUF373 family)
MEHSSYDADRDEQHASPTTTMDAHQENRVALEQKSEEYDALAHRSGLFLDRVDTIIYSAVGICFLLASLLALIYTFWQFGAAMLLDLPTKAADARPAFMANAIVDMVSGLLLVLIIVEILSTVIHYLKSHTTSLRPFLFIGIISATRSILSIGARLSVTNETVSGATTSVIEFNHSMIELGVSAAVILALGITLKLLGRLTEEHEK